METTQLSRRAILAGTAASLAMPRMAMAQAGCDPSLQAAPSLKEKSKGGTLFGLVRTGAGYASNRGYYDKIFDECAIYSPENDFCWANLSKTRGIRAYGTLDTIVRAAQAKGVSIFGHTLMWYHTVPKWLTEIADDTTVMDEIESYISETVSRYRGQIVQWNVVNEAIRAPDRPDGLRRNLYIDRFGPDSMKRGFALARAADPKASLCCAEYGIEYVGTVYATKRNAFLALLRKFRDDKVEIDNVGLQSHLDVDQKFDFDGLTSFLREVKQLGYSVSITELDVLDKSSAGDTATRDQLIADHVKDYLTCVTGVIKPTSIAAWGFTDGQTWLKMFNSRKDGRALRPLPYDDDYNRKKMWAAIAPFIG